MIRWLFRRSRPAPLDATGPATCYGARAGAFQPPLADQSTVILDTRPLMTRLARQRACSPDQPSETGAGPLGASATGVRAAVKPAAATIDRWRQDLSAHQQMDGGCPKCGTEGRV